jgi:hypothetical protein
VSAQATAARIGQGPVLAVILGAAAVVGFGIGTLIGSQDPRFAVGDPGASAALPSPVVQASTPTAVPTPSPSTAPAASPSQPAATAAQPQEIILQISGTGHDVSEPFDVISGWQIQWQTDGDSLAIAVTGDQVLGVVVDEPGPASGVTSLAAAGTYRLDIAARGPWSITVVQGGG